MIDNNFIHVHYHFPLDRLVNIKGYFFKKILESYISDKPYIRFRLGSSLDMVTAYTSLVDDKYFEVTINVSFTRYRRPHQKDIRIHLTKEEAKNLYTLLEINEEYIKTCILVITDDFNKIKIE